MSLTLDQARTIVAVALDHAIQNRMKPVAIVVLDARGAQRAALSMDGTSLKRTEIAHGKAYGAISLGLGSRSLFKRAREQPFFIAAATAAIGGTLIPVPGGLLIRAGDEIVGAVGVSGCTSENDEAAALAGIAAAGLTGDTGAD